MLVVDGKSPSLDFQVRESLSLERDEDDDVEGKSIYMVSDGTGWTAEHSVNAALGQFEHCLVDRGCAVNTRLLSGIDDVERLMEIIKQAAKEGAMLVYTLADPSMAESAKKACMLLGIPSTYILGPITEAIASHLGVSPSGLPRGAPGRTFPLSEEYFRRIEAIEFTIKQDDGALPQNFAEGQHYSNRCFSYWKNTIINLFGTEGINSIVLQTIRKARAKSLGFREEIRSNYSEMDYVREELEFAGRIFAQNPVWPK